MPTRPTLTYAPVTRDCTPEVQGLPQPPDQCVTLWRPDWLAIGAWALTLEQELRAACLALGGSAVACGAGEHD